jgi:glucosamine 6-phosphate synthetase-like amidotransferase/phosphosugar isomerase protein
LRFPNSDVVTAGSISFLDSALTCISLVKSFKIKNPEKIFAAAVKQAKKVKLGTRIFFLGNLYTYPLALYGAAKIFEVLGFAAFYERLEQFSHMELFSSKPGDTVIIFEQKNPHNIQLVKNLKKARLDIIQPTIQYADKISQFLFYTFFCQLVPLFLAKKKQQKQCHFVTAKKLRKISDNMIY